MKRNALIVLTILGLVLAVPASAQLSTGTSNVSLAQATNGDAQSRWTVLQEIVNGTYTGSTSVSINFTETELRQVILPMVQRELNNNNIPVTLNTVTLTGGQIELSGNVQQPFAARVVLFATVRAAGNGNVRINITRMNVRPTAASGFVFDTTTARSFAMKMPNFRFTSASVNGKTLRIRGTYTGANRTTTSTPAPAETTPTTPSTPSASGANGVY